MSGLVFQLPLFAATQIPPNGNSPLANSKEKGGQSGQENIETVLVLMFVHEPMPIQTPDTSEDRTAVLWEINTAHKPGDLNCAIKRKTQIAHSLLQTPRRGNKEMERSKRPLSASDLASVGLLTTQSSH
ncbi:hypothetical protein EV421DRAFT_1736939 [Armillaria borealis]|uniref:Uncharacterized protein n=1 Tax=Armillaria borealis TaxID=47425 RepID=A0AA39MN89_9AGAR|nr:hypothetical protein EV421DRAFT_1736939 [Armillaria borealis]